MGMGLSHTQVHDWLAFLLGAMVSPSRSKIHRWAPAAGKAAGVVLKRLDDGGKGCWCWSAVSMISSSTADRSWWGLSPTAWCGFWGPKPPITKV